MTLFLIGVVAYVLWIVGSEIYRKLVIREIAEEERRRLYGVSVPSKETPSVGAKRQAPGR